ncbi:hypothetical protein H8959_014165 [Pygathrix nigripes]
MAPAPGDPVCPRPEGPARACGLRQGRPEGGFVGTRALPQAGQGVTAPKCGRLRLHPAPRTLEASAPYISMLSMLPMLLMLHMLLVLPMLLMHPELPVLLIFSVLPVLHILLMLSMFSVLLVFP